VRLLIVKRKGGSAIRANGTETCNFL